MGQHSLLTAGQRSAIAGFLSALPTSVELEVGDVRRVERGMRDYWHEYL